MRDLALFSRNVLLRNQSIKIALGLAVFFLIESWLYPAYFQVPVTINGRTVVASGPTTVADILTFAGYNPGRGHLLDVDGRILKSGVGLAPRIRINGRRSGAGTRVKRDDKIDFLPGANEVERVQAGVEEIMPPARISGAGRYVVVSALGAPGTKWVSRGTVSGKIVGARNVTEPRATVVSRTDFKPLKVVALTFDDGPKPPFTPQIVKILKEMYATATFFMLGKQVAAYPELVREVQQAGFQIANHSWSHHQLHRAPEDIVIRELDDTRNLIFPITNYEPRWFRPPYGSTSQALLDITARRGYRLVKWNVDSRDWELGEAEAVVNMVMSNAWPGAIVLMHDGGGDRTKTVQALPKIIQKFRAQGYSFVTLDQLVGE